LEHQLVLSTTALEILAEKKKPDTFRGFFGWTFPSASKTQAKSEIFPEQFKNQPCVANPLLANNYVHFMRKSEFRRLKEYARKKQNPNALPWNAYYSSS